MITIINSNKQPYQSVIGLDVSTKTGWCYLSTLSNSDPVYGTISAAPQPNRFVRYDSYVKQFDMVLSSYAPKLLLIEGYGYANAHSLATLVELGTLLRAHAYQRNVPFLEVPPSTLKKFVTGAGNTKKEQMIVEIYKRWGIHFQSNDEADAFALAQFGLHYLDCGKTGLPKANLQVVKDFRKKYPIKSIT